MIKEAIGKGATFEEAYENAKNALGASETEDVQFEIISTGKKKVLGLFGGEQAEVRVFVEKADATPKKKESNKKRSDKKAEQKAEKKVEEKTAKPKKEKAVAKKNSVDDDYKDAVDAATLPADSSAGRAVAYLADILTKLGCTAITAKVSEKENGAFIILDAEDIGVVIGHRGETLDALQYLAGLAANNGGGYYKISLNIGNYREKREQTLVALANRVAEQVLATGRNKALEPMNPYERRIIHTAVQDIEGVISGSVGEGTARRVVIAKEGNEIRAPRNDRRSNNGRGRNSHTRADRRPSNTVASTPSREPKKDSDIPLYGKIN